jgi:hypothetical protein
LQCCGRGSTPPAPLSMRTLDRLAEVGAKVEAAGNRLIVRAGPRPVPGELVQRLREAKADVLAGLAPAAGRTPAEAAAVDPCNPREAAWWRRHFIIRAMRRGQVFTPGDISAGPSGPAAGCCGAAGESLRAPQPSRAEHDLGPAPKSGERTVASPIPLLSPVIETTLPRLAWIKLLLRASA